MKFTEQFTSARRVSTPLIAVRTPDPAATVATIGKVVNGVPFIIWDVVRGLSPGNESELTQAAISVMCGNAAPDEMTNPVETLVKAVRLPKRSCVVVLNAHLFLKDPAVVQAIWNLRDVFKQDFRTLVILCPDVQLPPELSQDVILMDEPFPTDAELEEIVKEVYSSAKAPEPKPAMMKRTVSSLRGLAAFPAEQVSAMSITKEGIDIEQCWERKYAVVEETPALSVWRGKESFSDVEGLANIKGFLTGIFKGQEPPEVVVFIDEIEKIFAGVNGDTSGTSQQQHRSILTWMENKKVPAIMFVGQPGAAKTTIAHACGGEFKVPVIAFDIDAAQGSLVGQTGEQTRTALKVIDAMGKPLVIATSNQVSSLSPELRRRFKLGTFYFDLLTKAERIAVWNLYLKKYKLSANGLPDDEGWTGAEIETCCDLSWRLKIQLRDAAQFVVPVSRANAERVASLRQQAAGKWISASESGTYRLPQAEVAKSGRAISGM